MAENNGTDKKIEEEEIKICKDLANKLKLSSHVVDDLIDSTINSD